MVNSNIVSVFVKPSPGETPSPPSLFEDTDCIPCTVVQLITAIGLGTYLQTQTIFREPNGTIDVYKNPKWWRNSVRGLGIGLMALGVQRMYHIYELHTSNPAQ